MTLIEEWRATQPDKKHTDVTIEEEERHEVRPMCLQFNHPIICPSGGVLAVYMSKDDSRMKGFFQGKDNKVYKFVLQKSAVTQYKEKVKGKMFVIKG